MLGRPLVLQDYNPPFIIKAGARNSPLSKVQVEEISNELVTFYQGIELDVDYVATIGDKDQSTSLVDLNKTDFFTKEIDQMLLDSKCRIAIHSAKDLPEPLPKGITMAALTKGVDSSDVLVLRSGMPLDRLPINARIGVSSHRRREAVIKLIPGALCKDIRGTIGKRLSKLDDEEYDGVVIALAALIRLGLTHRNYIFLDGNPSPMQGKLAVLCRSEDEEMLTLFAPLDIREKALIE